MRLHIGGAHDNIYMVCEPKSDSCQAILFRGWRRHERLHCGLNEWWSWRCWQTFCKRNDGYRRRKIECEARPPSVLKDASQKGPFGVIVPCAWSSIWRSVNAWCARPQTTPARYILNVVRRAFDERKPRKTSKWKCNQLHRQLSRICDCGAAQKWMLRMNYDSKFSM